MAINRDEDQFSTSIAVRVRSEKYIQHMKSIFNLLGKKQVHGIREALDIGIRMLVERDGSKEDQKILKQHLEGMDKS